MSDVIHDFNGHEFYIELNNDKSLLQYHLIDNSVLDFYRTFVPDSLRGQGLAQKLVVAGLDFAQQNNYKVKASCWFVEKYLNSHSEYANLRV